MVDHDLGRHRVLQKGLEWTESEHLVEERVDQVTVVEPVQSYAGALHVLLGQAGDPRSDALPVRDIDLVGVPFDEHRVNRGLGCRQRGREP